MTTREILEKVRNGTVSPEDAELFFQEKPYEELGYAKLDLHRAVRSGYPEVVYCPGKADAYLVGIFQTLYEKNGKVMGTRADLHQADLVRETIPEAEYDPISRILSAEKTSHSEKKIGEIAVCTGGTADIAVAEEAAKTAEFLGNCVNRIYDVGVSGIHRLLSKTEEIRRANVVVAVAGMEGALAGVVAGLVENPVIAVPTSIGYGANFKGLSSLLTMLNSCANGITVVNIDNGYGAGYAASQINRLASRTNQEENK